MAWQTAVLLQVLVTSFAAIFVRHIVLSVRQVFFGIGMVSYITIGVMGVVYALLHNHHLTVPTGQTWLYIFIEGFCIPAAWLFQYKLISYVGAANAMIASTVNAVVAATAGVLLLHDELSSMFVVGSLLIISSTLVALRIQPDTKHHIGASLPVRLMLVLASALFYAVGMFAEKKAVDSIGTWDYIAFGWVMQGVGASVLFAIFGLGELQKLGWLSIKKGMILGFMTSVAGTLYVYALSLGELSKTQIAVSGRAAITLLLAAILLRERNALRLRIAAFALSVIGIALIT